MICQPFQSPSIQQIVQQQNSFQVPKKRSSLDHTRINNLFIPKELPIFDLTVFEKEFTQHHHAQTLLKIIKDWNKDVESKKKRPDCRSQLAINRFIFMEMRSIQRKTLNQKNKHFDQLICWFKNITKSSSQNPYYFIQKKNCINQENQIRKMFQTNAIDGVKSYRRKQIFSVQSRNLKNIINSSSSKILKDSQKKLNQTISEFQSVQNQKNLDDYQAQQTFTQNLKQIFYRKESQKNRIERQLNEFQYLQKAFLRDKSTKRQKQLENFLVIKINNRNDLYQSHVVANKKFNLIPEYSNKNNLNECSDRKMRFTCRQRFFKPRKTTQIKNKQNIDSVTGINLISSPIPTPKSKSRRRIGKVLK